MNSVEAVLSMILAGSGTPQPANNSDGPVFIPEVKNTPDAVVVRVLSRGCTSKKDFRIKIGRHQSLNVKRLRKDRCKKTPSIIELQYSYKELGLPQPNIVGSRIVSK